VALPDSFGRYRVTGSLGAGAMGEVVAAVDDVLGREVAVKTLRGRTTGLAARIADERFRLEARAIAQLTHPSVVQVYDLNLDADPPYLVMERVAGPSLKERLADGPLPDTDVRALGIQIANALAAAHARGILHRDVKPANILAAGPGAWKLADFGVAHVPDSSLTITGQFVGSPAYAPPEALLRGQLGAEGDVFGLGATLYQAAAGTWPRTDADTRGLLAPTPPLRSIAPGVAPEIAAVIDRALAVEPADRPTAAELAVALAVGPGASTSHAAAAVDLPAVPAAARAKASYRWKHTVAGIATLLAIILIAATRSSPSAPTGTTIWGAGAAGGPGAPGGPGPGGRDEPERRPPPSMIDAKAPAVTTEEQARDWRKVLDKLQRRQFGEARNKLAEWETKHGETPETRDLAAQLDALPEHVLRGGKGKGKFRGRDD